jgi:hypothetical protein
LLHVLQEILKATQRLIHLKGVIKEKRRNLNNLNEFRNAAKQSIQLLQYQWLMEPLSK